MRKIAINRHGHAVVFHDFVPSDLAGCEVEPIKPVIPPFPEGDIGTYIAWEKMRIKAISRAKLATEIAMRDKFEPVASPMTTEVPPADPLKKEVWDRLVAEGVVPEVHLASRRSNN
jgi:hypothetical protein